MSAVSEQALLAAAQGGDAQAFDRLVEPHRVALHAHCHRMLGSLHDAEDGLQEALLQACRSPIRPACATCPRTRTGSRRWGRTGLDGERYVPSALDVLELRRRPERGRDRIPHARGVRAGSVYRPSSPPAHSASERAPGYASAGSAAGRLGRMFWLSRNRLPGS